jgi:hypothetical protein
MVAVLTAGRTALTTGSSGWLDGVVYDDACCLSLLSSRGPPLAGRHPQPKLERAASGDQPNHAKKVDI